MGTLSNLFYVSDLSHVKNCPRMKSFQCLVTILIFGLSNLYSQCTDIIVADSSFEAGVLYYDSTWTPDDGISVVTSPVFHGSHAVCSNGGGVYQSINVIPNTTYYLSCWVKNGLYDFSLRVDHLPFGATIDTSLVTTDDWQFVSMPFTTNNVDTMVGIRYWSNGACVDLVRVTCEQLTATTSLQVEKLTVFPNPTQEKSILNFNHLPDAYYTLNIFNSTGHLVKTIPNIQNNQIELYRDNLPKGLYLLQLRTKNSVKAIGKWLLE